MLFSKIMENIFHIADCCRACLRIECSLTPTTTLDNDSIKFCEKLNACVSEIAWMKEGLPSLICSTCIEKLRVAYDFKNVCLQSDLTLQKYTNHLQHDLKESQTTSKFDITLLSQNQDNLPCIVEEPQNAEYLHLKHFLDNDEDLSKADGATSRSCSPEISTVVGTLFLNESEQLKDQSHLFNQNLQHQHNQTVFSLDDHPVLSPIEQATNQNNFVHDTGKQSFESEIRRNNETEASKLKYDEMKSQNQVLMRTMGIQVRPSSAKNGENKPYTCKICDKSYRKNANLRIHMRIHTGERPFECKYCEKRFYHSSHLREHIRRHTGEKPFQCALCSKRFTIRGELTMHIKSHTGEKPFACTTCNRRCLTAADLKVHMAIHTGEKPFMCTTCGRFFASPYILKHHIKTHTGERPYPCTECSKTFTQSSHLQAHMRKHTGEKLSCKVCNAKFSYSSQLTVHMREHTGKQPFKCKLCSKNCKYATEFEAHLRKHSGEKYSCDGCDKKFTTLAYLQEHNRTHTGENLSTCCICERQFTRRTYLEKHMCTHTGEKPYSCDTCGKKFTQTSSLKVHIRRAHSNGEKPFECQVCDLKFMTSADLSDHNKKHDQDYISL